MTIDLTSGAGLFDRLGAMGYVIGLLDTFQGTTLPAEIEDVLELYDSTSTTIRDTVEELLEATTDAQARLDLQQALRTAAENTLIEMADADNPLTARTVSEALEELIRQMIAGSASVDASTVSATVTAASGNAGDAQPIVAMVDGTGKALENALAEDITLVCTDNATEGSESYSWAGEEDTTTDRLDSNWPKGSGDSGSLTAGDPSSDGFLTNGDFEDFTVANTPDGWTLDTGSAGTAFLSEATVVFRGSKSLELVGNGSTAHALSEDLSASALEARVNYPISIRLRSDQATPGNGVIVLDLYDGSGVIADDAGTDNSLSIDLAADCDNTWQVFTTTFRLPDPLPASITFRIRSSQAIANSETLYIDDVYFGPAMENTYTGGPDVAIVRGASRPAEGDRFNLAIANNRAGAFQTLFCRLFNLPATLLPSDGTGSETIDDALIA